MSDGFDRADMKRHDTYEDWFRNGPLGNAPQEQRSIAAGPVHLINVLPPPGGSVEPAVPEYALHLLLQTPPLIRVGYNSPLRWMTMSPDSLLLAPAQTECTFQSDGGCHVVTVAIQADYVEALTDRRGSSVFGTLHRGAFRDTLVAQLAKRLWSCVANDDVPSRLLADELTRALVTALFARAGYQAPQRRRRERLPARTVKRLRDYVESRLAEDIDVADLAAVAGLSAAHFARAFEATVGVTPFRYLMTRRLVRARDLLEQTSRTALDICLDVGFKSPSHFTSRFRDYFGVTPRAFRSNRPSDSSMSPGR